MLLERLFQVNKKILFFPDSLWGDKSGHRLSEYLIKAFDSMEVEVAAYAPYENYTKEHYNTLKSLNCKHYKQIKYIYKQHLNDNKIKKEFLKVLEDFPLDFVFYVGSIGNKVTINPCIEFGIKCLYLPLTIEYYCTKGFAGLVSGLCYNCIKGSIIASFYNKGLPGYHGVTRHVKNKLISQRSRRVIIKALKVVGYSYDQLGALECFGVPRSNLLTMPIFFNSDTA